MTGNSQGLSADCDITPDCEVNMSGQVQSLVHVKEMLIISQITTTFFEGEKSILHLIKQASNELGEPMSQMGTSGYFRIRLNIMQYMMSHDTNKSSQYSSSQYIAPDYQRKRKEIIQF